MKDTVSLLREAYDKMHNAFNDQKEMMRMMLHMQKQTLAASLKDFGSWESVNDLSKYFTNLHILDKIFNYIVPESLKLSQSGSVDVSEMTDNASMSVTSMKETSTSNISLTFDAIKIRLLQSKKAKRGK
eukprot:10827173-Ditylum_brightwellii.AAC.1